MSEQILGTMQQRLQVLNLESEEDPKQTLEEEQYFLISCST